MITKLAESSGKAVGFQATGQITAQDYEQLTSEVQALVDEAGSIGLLLDLEGFQSEAPSAWRADLEFGRAYRHKVERLAIVGDKRWQHLLAELSDPLFAREARFFHTDDRPAAWAWLRSG
jgi:hypothetical protein